MKLLKQTVLSVAILFLGLADSFTGMSANAGSVVLGMSPMPDQAMIVLYRDKKLKGSAADYKLYLNDIPLALLKNGTMAGTHLQPGKYDLWIEMYNPQGLISRAVTYFHWEANRVYYIKVDSYFISDGLTWRANATPMDEATARKETGALRKVKNFTLPTIFETD